MKTRLVAGALLSLNFLAVNVHAGDFTECTVQDPSSTPLNVRQGIWGKIVDKLPDGKNVTILRGASDKDGREWVKISYWRGQDYREGWVAASLINCQ